MSAVSMFQHKPSEAVAGEGVVLRPFNWWDVLRYVLWTFDQEVKEYFSPLLSAEDPRWIVTLWLKPATDIMGIWAPVGPNGRYAHVGGIGFQAIDRERGEAEFGFAIGREEWRNQGFGTIALSMLLEHAFVQLDLRSVYARVVAQNSRSLRVLEKMGFEPKGTKLIQNGKMTIEVIELRLEREAWAQAYTPERDAQAA